MARSLSSALARLRPTCKSPAPSCSKRKYTEPARSLPLPIGREDNPLRPGVEWMKPVSLRLYSAPLLLRVNLRPLAQVCQAASRLPIELGHQRGGEFPALSDGPAYRNHIPTKLSRRRKPLLAFESQKPLPATALPGVKFPPRPTRQNHCWPLPFVKPVAAG